jgi:omega-6 fatty acid desaturase (delta-12 desaturase)
VLFVIGPAFVFLFMQRLPVGLMKGGWKPWVSVMGTNLSILAVAGVLVLLGGFKPLLLVHIPILLIAAGIGVWLFYIQHQFEDVKWFRQKDWSLTTSALEGSSHYVMPQPLRWFTANIGIHHVHHLSSRVPYYRLPRVLRDYPELRDVGRITLMQSFACVRLVLWDEAQRRLVSFREI